MFDEEKLIAKIECGEKLTSEEVENTILYFSREKYMDYKNSGRRYIPVTTIIEIPTHYSGYKYYSLIWYNGLTPFQESEYKPQIAQEVKRGKRTKITEVWEDENGNVIAYAKPFKFE